VRDLLAPEAPQRQVVATKAPLPAAPKEPVKTTASLEAKPKAPVADTRTVVPVVPRAGSGVSGTTAGSSRRTWAYVSGGTGLALLLGGAAAGLQAKSAFDKEKSASASGDLAAYDSNKSTAGSMSKVADVLFVGGGVGLGVGTWLFFTSRPAALAFEVTPTPGGAVASISGGF